jgi:microcin C transport system permease protein
MDASPTPPAPGAGGETLARPRADARRRWLSPLNRRRLGELQGQPARLLVALDLPRPVRAVAVRRVHRQRPADPRLLQGRDPVPGVRRLSGEKFGGFLAITDYRDPFIQDEIEANGWMLWPPIRYSYRTVNKRSDAAPAPPWWMLTRRERCARAIRWASTTRNCTLGNWNWLGTDDQGRDVVARLIYGFRISVLFGLTLTIVSSVIGVAAGAVQGYFGGWTDLLPALHRDLDLDPGALPAHHLAA